MQLDKVGIEEIPRSDITIGVKPRTYGVKVVEGDDEGVTEMLVSASVDWFSVTTKDEAVGFEWYQAFCKYRNRYPLLVEDWWHQGGYRGQQCVGVCYGESEKFGFLLRATGAAAGEVIQWLMAIGVRNFRVTRMDFKVDVKLEVLDEEVASRIFFENETSKRPSFKLVKAGGGSGETVYVGSPQSDTSARIYDKGREMAGIAGSIWRYEVIYRKPIADVVYDDFRQAWNNVKQINFILDSVGAWLESRGLVTPWPHEPETVPVIEQEKTPWQNKLEWLERSVRKTVLLLCEAGFEDEVIQALGLTEKKVTIFDKSK